MSFTSRRPQFTWVMWAFLCALLVLSSPSDAQSTSCVDIGLERVSDALAGRELASRRPSYLALDDEFSTIGFSWSVQHERLLLYSENGLSVLNAGESDPLPLFRRSRDKVGVGYAEWSADGNSLYYIEYQRNGNNEPQITLKRFDLAPGDHQTVYTFTSETAYQAFTLTTVPTERLDLYDFELSPSGDFLAFEVYVQPEAREVGSYNVYLLSGECLDETVGNCDLSRIVPPAATPKRSTDIRRNPSWSPDGRYIAFTCAIDLCVLDTHTMDIERVDLDEAITDAQWLPCANQISLLINSTIDEEVFLLDWETRTLSEAMYFSDDMVTLPGANFLFDDE